MSEPGVFREQGANYSNSANDRANAQKKSVYDSLTKENTFVFHVKAESRIGRPHMNKRLLIVIKDNKGEESASNRVYNMLERRGLLSREYDTIYVNEYPNDRAFNAIKSGRGEDWYHDPYFGNPEYEEYLNS